jgi:hypothetical protein
LQPSIDIIIVNWNGGSLLHNAVQSILESDYSDVFIYIMDNGSTDDSCSLLPISNKISIIYLYKNLGFGGACNMALQYCSSDYILLLNPDAKIFNNTLAKAIQFLQINNKVGVYGAAQVGDDGNIMRTCGRYPNLITFCNDVLGLYQLNNTLFKNGFIMHDWDHQSSKTVKHVMGSFYLVRRSIIDKLGFMDDRYFVYMEDLDLSKRITTDGYTIYYDSKNVIYHKGGGVSENVKAKRLYYVLHAKFKYIKKHFNFIAFLLASFVLIVVSFFARIAFSLLLKRSFKALKETFMGYLYFYKYLLIGKF